MGQAGVQECTQCKGVSGGRGAGAVEGAGSSGDAGVQAVRKGREWQGCRGTGSVGVQEGAQARGQGQKASAHPRSQPDPGRLVQWSGVAEGAAAAAAAAVGGRLPGQAGRFLLFPAAWPGGALAAGDSPDVGLQVSLLLGGGAVRSGGGGSGKGAERGCPWRTDGIAAFSRLPGLGAVSAVPGRLTHLSHSAC